jgi:hypothetical protein
MQAYNNTQSDTQFTVNELWYTTALWRSSCALTTYSSSRSTNAFCLALSPHPIYMEEASSKHC